MSNSTMRVLTMACGFAVAVLLMPAASMAGIFGCHSCAAPVAMAPACSTCAPQTVQYMPTVAYRSYYRPTVVTAYQPVVGCNTCGGYAVTTYRPWYGGWTTYSAYSAPLVPYTASQSYYAAYQPVYAAMPVVTYSGCSSCASYSPCSTCSSCASCNSCGGNCGTVSYGAPASSCSSCGAAPVTMVSPAPATSGIEAAPAVNAAPPKTFQERVDKPATEPELKPIPRTDTQLNSMPAPALPDPKGRTASRSDSASGRVVLTAASAPVSTAESDDGWRPAKD